MRGWSIVYIHVPCQFDLFRFLYSSLFFPSSSSIVLVGVNQSEHRRRPQCDRTGQAVQAANLRAQHNRGFWPGEPAEPDAQCHGEYSVKEGLITQLECHLNWQLELLAIVYSVRSRQALSIRLPLSDPMNSFRRSNGLVLFTESRRYTRN